MHEKISGMERKSFQSGVVVLLPHSEESVFYGNSRLNLDYPPSFTALFILEHSVHCPILCSTIPNECQLSTGNCQCLFFCVCAQHLSYSASSICGCVISSLNLDRSRYFECMCECLRSLILVQCASTVIQQLTAIPCIYIRHSVDSITSSWKLDKTKFCVCARFCVKDTSRNRPPKLNYHIYLEMDLSVWTNFVVVVAIVAVSV